MTHPSDYAPKRNPAAEIVDMNRRAPLRDVSPPPLPPWAHANGAPKAPNYEQVQPLPPPAPRALNDLEHIAQWFKFLPYDDMKTFATDVMGDKKIENPGDLADLVNDWQKRISGASA